jgi:beta-phosphoglucomutase-like phosphatase (HAD superfamily)
MVAREDYENSKPDPEPYLIALARMKLAPENCLVIEDSDRGLAAARAARLRCVVVPNALTRGSAFTGAAEILEDITSLPNLIVQMRSEAS